MEIDATAYMFIQSDYDKSNAFADISNIFANDYSIPVIDVIKSLENVELKSIYIDKVKNYADLGRYVTNDKSNLTDKDLENIGLNYHKELNGVFGDYGYIKLNIKPLEKDERDLIIKNAIKSIDDEYNNSNRKLLKPISSRNIYKDNYKGTSYKERIQNYFKNAREEICPEIKDSDLFENGAIYYCNGNDGTDWDWKVNENLCEFYQYYDNEEQYGFMKLYINYDGTAVGYAYLDGGEAPAISIPVKNLFDEDEVIELANIMYEQADGKHLYDVKIDLINMDAKPLEHNLLSKEEYEDEYDDEYEDDYYDEYEDEYYDDDKSFDYSERNKDDDYEL